jgi:hypothetical protein
MSDYDNGYDEGYRAGMQKMREVGQARIEELEATPSPEAIVRAALERAARVADKKIFHFTGHWAGALLEGEFKKILDLASDPAEVAAILKKAGEDRG